MNLLDKYKVMIKPQRRKEAEAQTALTVSVTPQIKKEASLPEYLWQNPYPQRTPEAKAESLRVVEAARRGEPI